MHGTHGHRDMRITRHRRRRTKIKPHIIIAGDEIDTIRRANARTADRIQIMLLHHLIDQLPCTGRSCQCIFIFFSIQSSFFLSAFQDLLLEPGHRLRFILFIKGDDISQRFHRSIGSSKIFIHSIFKFIFQNRELCVTQQICFFQ